MTKSELDIFQKATIENAKWVDSVLLSGVILASIIVAAKITGATEFEYQTVKFSVNYSWSVFLILTGIHFYTARLLRESTVELWGHDSDEKCLETYQEIRATGGIFVRGAMPRTKLTRKISMMRIYEMKLTDPSTWATYILAIILILAIVPFDISNYYSFLGMLVTALLIAILNWLIGSMWLIPLSELTLPKKTSVILSKEIKGFIILASGVTGVPVGWCFYIILLILFAISEVLIIGLLYLHFNSIGQKVFFVKSFTTIISLLLIPRLIKNTINIPHFGKIIFVILFFLLVFVVISLYLTRI